MKVGHETVIEQDVRPARQDGTCFYCSQPLGHVHNIGCVILQRSVVIEFKIRVIMAKPRDHDFDLINFGYNEGSWCADNLADKLKAWADTDNLPPGCLCGATSAKVIREATADDHKELPYLDHATEPVQE